MNKTLSLIFLCGWFCCQAQTPGWTWARSAQSGVVGFGEGVTVASDSHGNAFIAGGFTDTITFGSQVMKANGYNAFIARYDANGNFKWAASNTWFHNMSQCFAYGVCADKNGNSYITGWFLDTVQFGSFTLISHAYQDIFLVKYDSTGNVLWAKSAGGNYSDYGYGITCDHASNVYITGYFESTTIIFGNDTLTNTSFANIFLAKFDSAGNTVWARRAGGTGDDIGYSVATDTRGNVFVTGYFISPAIIFGSDTLRNAGNEDAFLAKYDSSGHALWGRSAGGTLTEDGWSVAVDPAGSAYVTGQFNSLPMTFGSHTVFTSGSLDGFILKCDSSGNTVWVKDIGGTLIDKGYCIAADKYGKIYISGSIASNTITFDTISLPKPNGSNDAMFIFCSDTAGHALWAKGLTSGGDDNNAVAVTDSGCIYVGGDFGLGNPFIVGHDSLPVVGREDVFVAKLCDNSLSSYFTTSANTICAEGNNCVDFSDYSTGNPTSWQWSFPGASPSSSTQQNPINICYNTPGTYPVTLIVSDGTVTDTLTVANMIMVGGTPPLPIVSVVGGDTLMCSQAAHYQWYLNGNVISGATDSFYVEHQNGTYSVQITDQYGCQAVSAGVEVGIDEMSGGGRVVVYPNPVDKELAVGSWQLAKGATVGVYNVLGEEVLVLQSEINSPKSEIRVDVSAMSDGIYFLKINSERLGTVNKKFIVLHK